MTGWGVARALFCYSEAAPVIPEATPVIPEATPVIPSVVEGSPWCTALSLYAAILHEILRCAALSQDDIRRGRISHSEEAKFGLFYHSIMACRN